MTVYGAKNTMFILLSVLNILKCVTFGSVIVNAVLLLSDVSYS